ncbi:MAG TPA: serine hydrolase [Acidobacteriota bacterium]|nr:serine hydrolase [Acidobacteriota bacterium]
MASRRSKTVLLFLVLIAGGLVSIVAGDPLQQQIETLGMQAGAEAIGIYFRGYDGKTFSYQPDEMFHAASTMKVPVMMEVFHQVQQGKLKLDQSIPVKNEFQSMQDGSAFALDPADEDGDKSLYEKVGQTLPLKDLVDLMITQSSNFATNLVIQQVSPTNVMALMKEIGANHMNVLRGVQDLKAYEAGKNNTTDAQSLARCYEAILNSKVFTASSRDAMIAVLLAQHFRSGIPAGIKAEERNLKVANKDGLIEEDIHHDSAIITNPAGKSAVLVILTRGVRDDGVGKKLVADLAGAVYDFYNR